jgi:hypothetical protein
MAIADDIAAIEKKLAQLKNDYEQYFMGLQKTAPEKLRSEVERLIQFYSSQRITNAALNFRYKAAVSRYNSYRSYWDRVLREIEEGRYVRDVFKMRLHDRMREAAAQPAKPKEAPAEEDKIKRIYEEYIEARKKTHEPPVKYEAFAEIIKKQAPAIIEKYHCSSVDFKVVIEDGKAKLKAVPKK